MPEPEQPRGDVGELLNRIAGLLSTASPEALPATAMQALAELGAFTGVQGVAVYVRDLDARAFRLRHSWFATSREEESRRVRARLDESEPAWGWMLGNVLAQRPAWWNAATELPRDAWPMRDGLASVGIHAGLAVPMVAGNTVYGLVAFEGSSPEHDWDAGVQRSASLASGIIGAALQRADQAASLREALATAEQASRARDAFLATMSHEIRTPINGLLGMLEVLGNGSLDNSQRYMLTTARKSGDALLSLIDDILDFTQLQAGDVDVRLVDCELAPLVETVGELLWLSAADNGVRLSVFTDPVAPRRVHTDEKRVRQVLLNLVRNAIKFSAGGHVHIALQPAAGLDGGVEVTVADTGIGMSEHQVAELFKPFSQLESSTRRKFSGTGLGLAMCKSIADVLGARLSVSSEPDIGSTFTLWLPAAGQGEEEVERTQLEGIEVLVVDEQAEPATSAIVYLRYWGATAHHVTSVADARQTLTASEPGRPHVVIMGSSVLGSLREVCDARPTLPVVALGENTRARRRIAGADSAQVSVVHASPMRRASLLAAVADLVERPSPETRPLEPSTTTTGTQTSPAGPRAGSPGRLLIAEDNSINRQVIMRQLEMLGFRADVTEDGNAALAAWRKGDYAALLTDCHMPDMDGYELSRAIRAAEAAEGRERLPIIAITASTVTGERARCMDAGMDDCLQKPVEVKQLGAMVRRWVRAQPAPQSQPEPAPEPQRGAGPSERPVSDSAAADAGGVRIADVNLDALVEIFGDSPESIAEMLGEFMVSANAISAELHAAVTARSSDLVRAQAHKLKSSARTVGAAELGELCEGLEFAGRGGNWPGIEQLLPRFDAELAAVAAFVDRYP